MGMSLLLEQGLPICSRCPRWGMGERAENPPVPGLGVSNEDSSSPLSWVPESLGSIHHRGGGWGLLRVKCRCLSRWLGEGTHI